tara:strand:+ start:142 stop:1386 length:1245 start_codon:yes stop_codon:yes gene_type:complete
MNIDKLSKISELEAFLSGSQAVAFSVANGKDETYAWIQRTLIKFDYMRLKRSERGVLIQFLCKISGYSRQQITRLVKQYRDTGQLTRRQKTVNGFTRKYTNSDIKLLADMDERHETPNGGRIKKLFERAYHHYGECAYENLSSISVAHIYNLRSSLGYQRIRRHYDKTSYKPSTIGERRKPNANGMPGYIRIDTVHQGDLDGKKGVYHINAVDEVTQFEVVVSVKKVSEIYLIPALEFLLKEFPFVVKGFHSDNGSEYVNRRVAELLKKLLVQFTKSRPRHSNDNALAESKNASVIRKTFGYSHIEQEHADLLNQFNKTYLIPYLNYHRPCYFPTIIVDDKGKQKRKYRTKDMMTPYEKLKSLADVKIHLKPGITIEQLNEIENSMTDNQAADRMNEAKKQLFKQIHESNKLSA